MTSVAMREHRAPMAQKVRYLNWGLLLVVTLIACAGFLMLYSAANGSFEPWAGKQMIRFAVGFVVLIAVAMVDLRTWLGLAYVVYAASFALLVYVDVAGEIGMGAQRWIDLGFFQVQPSEIMKVALVLALARYFHRLDFQRIGGPHRLIVPLLLVLAPVGLVLVQPDLGTGGSLMLLGGAIFFLAGVRWWKFVVVLAAAAAALPVAWDHLRDYQKDRILTFLNPETDPLGAGYHILQSKIAFGSGGLFGKGYLEGTQSHLNFLPERQTDFIFTMLAEEFGLVGCVALLALYGLLFLYGYVIALRCRNQFGRILVLGLCLNLFIYMFINAAMVMGLIPVVGVPMPLVSYGGTAMITVLMGFGLIMAVDVNERLKIGRLGQGDEG